MTPEQEGARWCPKCGHAAFISDGGKAAAVQQDTDALLRNTAAKFHEERRLREAAEAERDTAQASEARLREVLERLHGEGVLMWGETSDYRRDDEMADALDQAHAALASTPNPEGGDCGSSRGENVDPAPTPNPEERCDCGEGPLLSGCPVHDLPDPEQEATREGGWTTLFSMLLGASLALGFTAPGSPGHLLVLLAALVALLAYTIRRRRCR